MARTTPERPDKARWHTGPPMGCASTSTAHGSYARGCPPLPHACPPRPPPPRTRPPQPTACLRPPHACPPLPREREDVRSSNAMREREGPKDGEGLQWAERKREGDDERTRCHAGLFGPCWPEHGSMERAVLPDRPDPPTRPDLTVCAV